MRHLFLAFTLVASIASAQSLSIPCLDDATEQAIMELNTSYVGSDFHRVVDDETKAVIGLTDSEGTQAGLDLKEAKKLLGTYYFVVFSNDQTVVKVLVQKHPRRYCEIIDSQIEINAVD